MILKTTKFDAAAYLYDEESIVAYLNDALESGDTAQMRQALGTAIRAIGTLQMAEDPN